MRGGSRYEGVVGTRHAQRGERRGEVPTPHRHAAALRRAPSRALVHHRGRFSVVVSGEMQRVEEVVIRVVCVRVVQCGARGGGSLRLLGHRRALHQRAQLAATAEGSEQGGRSGGATGAI